MTNYRETSAHMPLRSTIGVLLSLGTICGSCADLSSNIVGERRRAEGAVCPQTVLSNAVKARELCLEPAYFGRTRADDCGRQLTQHGFIRALAKARLLGQKTGKAHMCYGRP